MVGICEADIGVDDRGNREWCPELGFIEERPPVLPVAPDLCPRGESRKGLLPDRLALGGQRHFLQGIGAEGVAGENRRTEILRDHFIANERFRRDGNLRRLIAVEVDEVVIGHVFVQQIVQEQMGQDRLLAGRENRPAVVLNRTLAGGRRPVAQVRAVVACGQIPSPLDSSGVVES